MGYHRRKIQRGEIGKSSKIREELEELEDAEDQGNRILVFCELADLYGALQLCSETHGLSMEDLKKMADATRSSFESGER
jgi:phosphoribosyl-ATP pyrophosphohydrolase